MEGGGCSLIEECPSTFLEILSKSTKTLGRLTSNHIEIRFEQLLNTQVSTVTVALACSLS
jgi:hypothetical protein